MKNQISICNLLSILKIRDFCLIYKDIKQIHVGSNNRDIMRNRYYEEEPQWRKKIDDEIEFIKNLQAFVTGNTISFQEYLDMECKEIFGQENAWYTGQNLNRPPTHIDLHQNYIIHEGDKRFHKEKHYLVERRWQKNLKKYVCQIGLLLQKFWRGRRDG